MSALAAGLKTMLPSKRETPVTRAVAALMDNKPGPSAAAEDDAFGYLDPKVGDPLALTIYSFIPKLSCTRSPILVLPPPPTCIAHTIAVRLHD